MAYTERMPPVHPGEILRYEFLEPLELSQTRLAMDLDVPYCHINEIVNGKRRVTADTALRMARYFGMSAGFWLNLQTHYDLETEREKHEGIKAGLCPSIIWEHYDLEAEREKHGAAIERKVHRYAA